MRLDKLLSNMGFGSRKEVGKLLKKGAVKVNEETVKSSSLQVDTEKDYITILGEQVIYKEFVYLMMNKPQGILSATEDSRDETVVDILEEEDQHFKPFPVGRLDKDTEGFLLLTNDGKLAHNLLSPKKGVPKVYFAHVSGVVTEEDVVEFERGVMLDDGYVTKPGILRIIKSAELSEIELTITEGKYHQVKRMFEAVGKKVVYLKRLSMGPLVLDDELKLGEYRDLTESEIALLFNISEK
ncbi:pseudouridine synthase [Sporosarcina siberiensis]|uniref:Pseudouridine synthase n=1 Tax=Sporosarcina siberiensis TaxID=1365606 RepID=A0ABW4SE48_9BACL